MVITDQAYGQIGAQIAAHAPERGGALYGPRGLPFVTHFEFDPDGLTSAVSSVRLSAPRRDTLHAGRRRGYGRNRRHETR